MQGLRMDLTLFHTMNVTYIGPLSTILIPTYPSIVVNPEAYTDPFGFEIFMP